MKTKILWCSLTLGICFVGFALYVHPFLSRISEQENTLSVIPRHDFITEAYFADLFLKEGFGYTLLGARAMAIDWRIAPSTPFQCGEQKIICDSKNFLFKESPLDSCYRSVVFIHKAEFIKTFNQNKEIFRVVLGPDVTAEQLLHEIASSDQHFFSVLNFDTALLGILLGFGSENSLLFQRKMQITPKGRGLRAFLQPFYLLPIIQRPQPARSRTLTEIRPRPGFSSLTEELQWIQVQLAFPSCTQDEWSVYNLIFPLAFWAKQSAETEQLVKKYTLCKQILYDLFYDRNVVDVVMRELFSDHPISWAEYAEQNGLEST